MFGSIVHCHDSYPSYMNTKATIMQSTENTKKYLTYSNIDNVSLLSHYEMNVNDADAYNNINEIDTWDGKLF